MASTSRTLDTYEIASPHANEKFRIETDCNEVDLSWIRKDPLTGRVVVKTLFSNIPKAEIITTLKQMIEKLEQ